MNIKVINAKEDPDVIEKIKTSTSITNVDYKLLDFNSYQKIYPERNIEDMEKSILEIGLIEAPVVSINKDRYTILSGNTRCKALFNIIESGKEFKFGNRTYKKLIPVRISEGLNSTEELNYFLETNLTQRQLSTSERIELAKNLEILYEKEKEKGNILATNVKKWIAHYSGLSEKTSQTIRNEIRRGKKQKKTNGENFVSYLNKVNKRIRKCCENDYSNSERTNIIDELDDIVDAVNIFKKNNQV